MMSAITGACSEGDGREQRVSSDGVSVAERAAQHTCVEGRRK